MGQRQNKKPIKIFLKTNENEDMSCQNLCDLEKVVLRGKSMPMQAYIRKEERSHINNLRNWKINNKGSTKKEIIKQIGGYVFSGYLMTENKTPISALWKCKFIHSKWDVN